MTGANAWQVQVNAVYNVSLRYASSSDGQARLLVDSKSCNATVEDDTVMGTVEMPSTGSTVGPFARSAPLTVCDTAVDTLLPPCR